MKCTVMEEKFSTMLKEKESKVVGKGKESAQQLSKKADA